MPVQAGPPKVPNLHYHYIKIHDKTPVWSMDHSRWSMVVKSYTNAQGRKVHEMSNGLCYMLDDNDRWQVVLNC